MPVRVKEYLAKASLGRSSLSFHFAGALKVIASILLVGITICFSFFIRMSYRDGFVFFIDLDRFNPVAQTLVVLGLAFLFLVSWAALIVRPAYEDRFATGETATAGHRDLENALDERYRLITEGYLRPLTKHESARLEELDRHVKANEIERADELTASNRGSRAAQLDARLDRLEHYIGTLKSHVR